jgi:hypothetical protein
MRQGATYNCPGYRALRSVLFAGHQHPQQRTANRSTNYVLIDTTLLSAGTLLIV